MAHNDSKQERGRSTANVERTYTSVTSSCNNFLFWTCTRLVMSKCLHLFLGVYTYSYTPSCPILHMYTIFVRTLLIYLFCSILSFNIVPHLFHGGCCDSVKWSQDDFYCVLKKYFVKYSKKMPFVFFFIFS